MIWNIVIQKIIVAGWLGLMSVQDIRQKKISVWMIVVLGILGFVFIEVKVAEIKEAAVMAGSAESTEITNAVYIWKQYLIGIVPGSALCIIGKISGNRIGSGDGYAIIALGLHMGIWNIMSCILYGTIFCALAAFIMLVSGKKTRKDAIPFLPFMTAGYLVTILWFP